MIRIDDPMTLDEFMFALSELDLEPLAPESRIGENGMTQIRNIFDGVVGEGATVQLSGKPDVDPFRKLLRKILNDKPLQFALLPIPRNLNVKRHTYGNISVRVIESMQMDMATDLPVDGILHQRTDVLYRTV